MTPSLPHDVNRRDNWPQSPLSDYPRICIVGGGFGGLYCALALHQRLQSSAQTGTITLIEPRERFLFTPLLYEPLTRELQPWEIAPTYTSLLSHTTVDLRRDRVKAIDLQARNCWLEQGRPLNYDYLVVALGSQQRPPSVPGSQTYSLTFNTLDDLLRLDDRLTELETSTTPVIRIVITGAGPSGVELACKLADRLGDRGEIVLLDRRTVILRSHSQAIQRAAQQALSRRRVKIFTSVSLDSVDADSMCVSWQGHRQQFRSDLTLWTVGIVPRPWPGNDHLALAERRQYQVHPTLQLPDYPNVFVLGDMAAMLDRRDLPAPMTAQAAFQAAPLVAGNICALMAGRPPRPFQYHHLGDMLTLGRGEAVVHGFGLCLTGRIGGISRLWAYWLRLPTWRHRWRVFKARLRRGLGLTYRQP